MLRLLLILLGVVVLAVVLAAVAGFESPPPPRKTLNAQDAARATLRYAITADCITLNPQGTSALTDFRVINCIFEGLLSTDARDLSLRPGVAVGLPDISDDGRVYTFTLREDARWSNGDAVTAHDFAFAWRRAITYDFASVYSELFWVVQGAEDLWAWRKQQLDDFKTSGQTAQQAWDAFLEHAEKTVGIEAVDDHTFRVTLVAPTAYFTELTTFGTLFPNHRASVKPRISLDKNTGRALFDSAYFTDAEQLVSNGAFALWQWNLRRRMVLDANPHYWNASSVRPGRIVQTVIEDNDELMLTRCLDGDFDWLPDVGKALAVRLKEAGTPGLRTVPRAGLQYYAFNVRDEVDGEPNPLADVRVRRALAMSIDKEALVDKVTRLGEPVAHSFVPVGAVRGYAPPVEEDLGYDPAAARALLAEAGYPGGKNFPTLRLLFNTNTSHARVAVRIANQWKQTLGVEVATENYEWRSYLDRRRKGQFHVVRSGWFGDYQDPTTWLNLLAGNNPSNAPGYQSAEYDALLALASAETGLKKRLGILRDAEALMLRGQPIVPLFQAVTVEMLGPGVRGLNNNAWNNLNLELVEIGATAED